MIDQDVLVANISSHLDSLDSIMTTIAVLAVATAWAGIQRSEKVEILGTSFDRKHAFIAVTTLFLMANLGILIHIGRIIAIASLLDADHAALGFSQLATHPSIFNPFSFYGDPTTGLTFSTAVGASIGIILLVATWWIGYSATLLFHDFQSFSQYAIRGILAILGLASLFFIRFAIEQQFELQGMQLLSDSVKWHASSRFLNGAGIGMFLGVLIYLKAITSKARTPAQTDPTSRTSDKTKT